MTSGCRAASLGAMFGTGPRNGFDSASAGGLAGYQMAVVSLRWVPSARVRVKVRAVKPIANGPAAPGSCCADRTGTHAPSTTIATTSAAQIVREYTHTHLRTLHAV